MASSSDHLQLPEKRPGDEPFESETEVEDKSSGKGIIGTKHDVTWGQYCEDDLTGMVVRGINFMSDKKKVDCTPPIYKLMHVDMFKTKTGEDRCAHYADKKDSWATQRWERLQAKKAAAAAGGAAAAAPAPSAGEHAATSSIALSDNPLAPLIIINFMIPGAGNNINLVLYFARRIKTAEELRKIQAERVAAGKKPLAPRPPNAAASYTAAEFESDDFPHDLDRLAAFDHLLKQFIEGSDEFRDARLKIVPRVAEGSWIVKKSIGRVPAILGKKVKQFYYRNEEKNYLEIDADLGTSVVAGKIIQMIKGTCKGLVVDMSFLLQGEDKSELPEALLGGVRMIRTDLDKMLWRDDNVTKNPMVYDV